MNTALFPPYGEVEIVFGPETTPSGIRWGIVKLPDQTRHVVNLVARTWDIPDPEEFAEQHSQTAFEDIIREMAKAVDMEVMEEIIKSIGDAQTIKPMNPGLQQVHFFKPFRYGGHHA